MRLSRASFSSSTLAARHLACSGIVASRVVQTSPGAFLALSGELSTHCAASVSLLARNSTVGAVYHDHVGFHHLLLFRRRIQASATRRWLASAELSKLSLIHI